MILNWKIENLEKTSEGVVFGIHYSVFLIDEERNASDKYNGYITIERDESEFVNFSDLTEEVVVQWLVNNLSEEKITKIENELQGQLEQKKTPIANKLPWLQ
jgi:nitrogen regulatory protein PII-like uncharacterized protein